MTRENLQQEIVELAKVHNNLVIEWSTGGGKTYAAFKIIESLGGNWNIVLAETLHEQNWIAEFKKHGKESLLTSIKFFCYQSLHKNLDGENYIFDEIHRLQSPKRLEFLTQIKSNKLQRFIGLSATLTWLQKLKLELIIGKIHTSKVTLSNAIENDILPEPIVYFLGIDLDDTVKNHIYKFNKYKSIPCTAKKKYELLSQRVDYYKDLYFNGYDPKHKTRWMMSALDRKKFLAEYKTLFAKELLLSLQNKRLICFGHSIEQIEQIANGLYVHSKLPKKQRVELLDKFNGGIIDQLFAVGMLKEGVNLNNIEAGLIIQLDNVERMFVQSLGRALRAVYPEQYVLYVKNTQDETYVKTALTSFDMNYVKFINFKEFEYGRENI